MICKNCKMYYQTTGRRYSNYCPKCGTYNLGLDRNFFISLIIAAITFGLVYFLT